MSPGTVAGGLVHIAPLFAPLMAAFRQRQLADPYWHADETGWKVFENVEGKANHRWYLWVYRSTSVIYFDLEPSRAAAVPLAHFQALSAGILVCDRYGAYKKLARTLGLLLQFCWAHVRRDALTLAQGYPVLAEWALLWVERIGTLYHLNGLRLDARNDPALSAQRTDALRLHLQDMAQARDAALQDGTLHEAAAKMMRSLREHWQGLTVFFDHPEIPLDNNAAERAVRGPVVGRKNYYGSGSLASASLAATMFTLLISLDQIWNINTRLWMQDFLLACAIHNGTPTDLSPFLPWTMSDQRLAYFGGKRPSYHTGHRLPIDSS
jgi:transposase